MSGDGAPPCGTRDTSVGLLKVAVAWSGLDDLPALLLQTGDATLVEHTENDAFWGDGGDGSGRNELGRVLMAVCESLRGPRPRSQSVVEFVRRRPSRPVGGEGASSYPRLLDELRVALVHDRSPQLKTIAQSVGVSVRTLQQEGTSFVRLRIAFRKVFALYSPTEGVDDSSFTRQADGSPLEVLGDDHHDIVLLRQSER